MSIDWDEVEEVAFGQLGWTPEHFNIFSIREFINAYRGHDKNMQQFWAMARRIGFYSQVQLKGVRKPQDLFPLKIDEPRKKNMPLGKVKLARVTKIGDN